MAQELDEKYIEEILNGDTYTLKEVAERLHVSVWSVRSYVRDGLIVARKQGREYIVPKSALREYIVGNIEPPEPKAKKAKPRGEEAVEAIAPVATEEPSEEEVVDDVDDEEFESDDESPRPVSFGFEGF